jgi:hypothetical protein
MAKIHEEIVVIKLSKLVKDSEHNIESFDLAGDLVSNLEAVVQELVGSDVIVEVASE